MNKNAVPITIVVCVLIVVAAAVVIVVKLHGSSKAAPSTTTTVTVTAPPSSSPGGSLPASTPPPATPTATPTATASTAPLTDVTVCITPVVTCKGELKTEPPEIIVSGDGSGFIKGLTWTGWGSEGATGSGTLEVDNCEPNCAQGSDTPYVATVTLSGLTPYGGGKQAYATMMVSSPGSPYGTQTYHHLVP